MAPIRATLLVCLLLGPSIESQQEVTLEWCLDSDKAIEFTISESGKVLNDASWVVLGTELGKSGEPKLVLRDHWDLPLYIALVLPEKPVKAKTPWKYTKRFFDVQYSIPEFPNAKALELQGQYVLKVQEEKGKALHVVEGAFEIYELTRQGADVKVGSKPVGSIRTVTTILDSLPRTISFSLVHPKGNEIQGSDLHGSCKNVKMQRNWTLEAKATVISLARESLQTKINSAVDSGLKWLKNQAQKDGSFKEARGEAGGHLLGVTALAFMALAYSGVSIDDPVMKLAYQFLLKQRPSQTYDTALSLMAIEAKCLSKSGGSPANVASEDDARKAIEGAIGEEERAVVKKLTGFLVENQTKEGYWGYPAPRGGKYDHSNTKYALLGLKASSRCGEKVPSDVWSRAGRYLVSSQQKGASFEGELAWKGDSRWSNPIRGDQGGWAYFVGDKDASPYGTMVCGGLAGLLICESELERSKSLTDADAKSFSEATKSAAIWLTANYSTRNCPPGGMAECSYWTHYLFALERAAIYLGVEKLGKGNWYLEGAFHLTRAQSRDGSWNRGLSIIDTSFALLFLKRALIPVPTKSGK